MELKWIEDFLSLAETRSFSRSAEARHVTQSAFSRRIRSLEVWLGTALLDRSTYPITLTADGRHFLETAEEVVRLLTLSRADFRNRSERSSLPVVAITALHSLCLSFLPRWLGTLRGELGAMSSRVLPENFNICLQALVEVDRRDHRLEKASQDRAALALAGVRGTLTQDECRTQLESAGDTGKAAGRDDGSPASGQHALLLVAVALEERLRHHQGKNSVPEELEPLIRVGRSLGVFIDVAAMDQRLVKKRRVVKTKPEAVSELSCARRHRPRSGSTG